MLLRELITRFGFDVDTKNVKKYDNAMSGMTSKAKKLALIFGGSFSAKQVLGLGLTVKQTSADLRRLAGTDFSKFNSAIEKTRAELEGIRKGSGDILPENKANAMGSFFIKNVGKSQQDIKDFAQLLKVASIAAINTRKSVSEVFTGLVGNRNNGGADALLGLGDFTKEKQGKLEYDMKIIASTDAPGGNLDRRIRGGLVRNELNEILPAMIQNLKNFDDELFLAKIAKSTVSDTVQKISSEATERSISFMKAITEIPDKGVKGALFDLDKPKPIFKGGGRIRRDTNELFFKPGNNGLKTNNVATPSTSKINVTNHNTFNIKSDDPRKVGVIVEQKMDEIFRDTSEELVKEENR